MGTWSWTRVRLVLGALSLGILAAGAPAGRSAPDVGLHHVTVIPDSATFAAIANSPFLRDTLALVNLAPAGERAAVALLARSSYLEFRAPGAGGGEPWRGHVALGSDRRGALDALSERLTSELGELRRDSLVLLRQDSLQIPWLYRLSGAAADGSVLVQIVEYHPDFTRLWFGATSPTVARGDVVALHARRAGIEGRVGALDVVGIKVAVPVTTEGTLLAHCRALGWRVQTNGSGSACVGSDVRLYMVPPDSAPPGVSAITMRVAAALRRSDGTRTFGRSTLRISRNGFATWEFHAPAAGTASR